MKRIALIVIGASTLLAACSSGKVEKPIYSGLINKVYERSEFGLVFHEDTMEFLHSSSLYSIKWLRHDLHYNAYYIEFDPSVDLDKKYITVYRETGESSDASYSVFGYFKDSKTFIRIDSEAFGSEYHLK